MLLMCNVVFCVFHTDQTWQGLSDPKLFIGLHSCVLSEFICMHSINVIIHISVCANLQSNFDNHWGYSIYTSAAMDLISFTLSQKKCDYNWGIFISQKSFNHDSFLYSMVYYISHMIIYYLLGLWVLRIETLNSLLVQRKWKAIVYGMSVHSESSYDTLTQATGNNMDQSAHYRTMTTHDLKQ